MKNIQQIHAFSFKNLMKNNVFFHLCSNFLGYITPMKIQGH